MIDHVIRRVVWAVALAVVMVAVASQVIGPPEIARSISFLNGGIPTLDEGEAVMGLIAWTVILVGSAGALLGAIRAVGWTRIMAQPSARVGLFLGAELLILAVGVAHRVLPATLECCASGPSYVREAIELAR